MKKRKAEHSTASTQQQPTHSSQKKVKNYLLLFCALLALVLYANTLGHDFVLDDEMAISKNTYVQEGMTALPKIFSTPYREGFSDRKEGLYRPLSMALFAAAWEIAPENPFPGHLGNVLIFVLTALLLFNFLTLCLENRNLVLPFTSTLLFVAHPIHTEVVANIKSADELLCFLFCLVTMWSVLKYGRLHQIKYLFLAGISTFLALLSKETAVAMLVMAPLTVYFFSKAGFKRTAISTAPVVFSFLVYLLIRISVLSGVSNFGEILLINNSLVAAGDNTLNRVATAVAIAGKYIWLLFFPYPLSFDYSYNTIPIMTPADAAVLVSFLALLSLAVIAIRGLKTKSPVSWALFFFAATLSPVTNIFFLIEATMGERFLYMPSLGFCLIISLLLARLFKTETAAINYSGIRTFWKANSKLVLTVMAITCIYGMITVYRNTAWKDNLTLVKTDVQTYPRSVRIRYAYGSILVMEKALPEKDAERKRKLLIEGTTQLAEAVSILPVYGDAWFNLGMGYKELEEYKKAIPCFEKAKAHMVTPKVSLFVASGIAYGEDGQYEKAIGEFRQAILLDSTSSDAFNNIGLYYSRSGNHQKSIEMLQKAIDLSPADDHPYYNMGNTYAAIGSFDKAIDYYKQAIKLNPQSDIAWVNLGNCYGVLKDYTLAVSAFEEALKINPANGNARYNLGTTYYMLGDTAKGRQFLPDQ